MSKYWCVNFLDDDCLRHGINESLWLMGYQYDRKKDPAWWKGRCSANWKQLQKIHLGDSFVAYVPRKELTVPLRGSGYAFFATGQVRAPRRSKTPQDATDNIESYLSQEKLYKSGYVYFPPSVVFENFTDGYKNLPVRIDVEAWGNYVPDGILVELDLSRGETVCAAFEIDKPTFERIVKKLGAKSSTRTSRRN